MRTQSTRTHENHHLFDALGKFKEMEIMNDIIFKSEEFVFSYRVAGILVRNGCVLLQRSVEDQGFAVPGGHVALGETSRDTLIREFKEEMGADIEVAGLTAVGELFFPWLESGKTCHQICLYYRITFAEPPCIPLEGTFRKADSLDDGMRALKFHWIPVGSLGGIELYPDNLKNIIDHDESTVLHFTYKE